MPQLSRKITREKELQLGIANAVDEIYDVAKASYGPLAGTALLELPYGEPIISRDGVTNLEKVNPEDPIEKMACRLIVQASRKCNRKVGDGTTAVAILACHQYWRAQRLIAAGMNPMAVSRQLEQEAERVIDLIEKNKIPATDSLLQHVARVSAGDQAIGSMIADVIKQIGIDGGVTVEDFAGVGIYNELVDGFYFRQGFTNVNLINDPTALESRHMNIDLLISEKRLATPGDLAPLLDKIVQSSGYGKDLVLVGEVSDEVMSMLMLNRLKGIVNVTPVDLPIHGPMRSLTMEDLALLTGGKVYVPGANSVDFAISMLGSAEKIIINEFSTTIIGGEGITEDITARIDELRRQLNGADSAVTVEALKDRIARLTGKVAIIRVGGATEVEQKEVKLRVEDAVCAVQAAVKDGVVPGGGVALARTLMEVFDEPFKQLIENAGYSSDKALWKMLEKKSYWYGYDLKVANFNYEPIDLLKAGVIDPASVIKEVVRNATSVIAKLITGKIGSTLIDRKEKYD